MRTRTIAGLWFPFASGVAVISLAGGPALAGSATWNASANSTWLTVTNWNPNTSYPGVAGTGANSDIATFATVGINGNACGINMNNLGGNSLSLGAILWNYTAAAGNIGNSSTTSNGMLQLNGATVNVGGTGGSINNLLAAIGDSATQNLTIRNAVGSGNKTMGVLLNNASGVFYVTSGRTLTISSIVDDGVNTYGFTKSGAGTLTLSGANTYGGVITISGGTLSINSFTNGGVAGSLGMASSDSSNLVMTAGTLSYSGGTATTNRGLTLKGNSIITVGGTNNLNIAGTIVTDTTAVDFTKGGTGTLTLSGVNTYNGRTFVSGGTLVVNSIKNFNEDCSLGKSTTDAGSLLSIGTGGNTTTFSYIGTGNETNRPINLPGTTGGGIIDHSGEGLLKFTGNMTATGAGSKTITLQGSTSGTGEYAGAIVDNSATNTTSLTKTGTGTWTLSGPNTYTGTTTVSQGSLIITGAVASTSVVVNGSLGGNGVMANATVSGAGSINPGNSPGILTVAATDPSGGLDYNFEFTAANTLPAWSAPAASVNDVLRLTGGTPFTAALGGTNTVTIYLNVASLTAGDVFTGGFYTDANTAFLSGISGGTFHYYLANAGGSASYGGNLYNPYTGPLDFEVATVSLSADFGAGVVNGFATRFTVMVPEPNIAALLASLGVVALVRRRR